MRNRYIIAASLLIVSGLFAGGQGGLNFTIGIPQGEFKENVDRIGIGISGHIAYQPNPFFAIGVALGTITYGSESRNEPFSTTIPDVMVEVTTTNNLAQVHMMMQVGMPMGYVKPYIEGRLGFNYLWTTTRIEDIDDQDEVASSTNFDDLALAYGTGGGLMIKVWEKGRASSGRRSSGGSGPDKVYIDLKAIYAFGGEAEYLKEGSIARGEGTEVIYDVSKSKTDLMTIHIGAAIEF